MQQSNRAADEAGGIVFLHSPVGIKIAIVHRPKSDEWRLPSGASRNSETLEEAAARVVGELIHASPAVMDFAGICRYAARRKGRATHFWNMEIDEQPKPMPRSTKGDEADIVEWVAPSSALRMLTEKRERAFLISAYFHLGKHKNRPIIASIKLLFASAPRERLSGSINAYRIELEYRASTSGVPSAHGEEWHRAAQKLLDSAQLLCDFGRLDESWKSFHAAQRMEISVDDIASLRCKADILRKEADKLSPWRQDAVKELLGSSGAEEGSVDRHRVYRAAILRDEHYDNQAYKINVLRGYLSRLTAILFVLLLLMGFVFWPFLNVGFDLVAVKAFLLGALGATVSAAFSATRTSLASKIPELATGFMITLFKIAVGGASALFILCIVTSGFLDSVLPQAWKAGNGSPSGFALYALAFVAGFSERLVLKSVEMLVEK